MAQLPNLEADGLEGEEATALAKAWERCVELRRSAGTYSLARSSSDLRVCDVLGQDHWIQDLPGHGAGQREVPAEVHPTPWPQDIGSDFRSPHRELLQALQGSHS